MCLYLTKPGSYDRDYEQELKDELDNLSSLMDQLSDVGDGMGNPSVRQRGRIERTAPNP